MLVEWRLSNFLNILELITHREPHPQSQNTQHSNKSKSISSTKRLFSLVLSLSLSLSSRFFHLYYHQASHCSATTYKHFVFSLIRQRILVGALGVTKMMCDSDPRMGSSSSTDWTQTMMMNMPATNISPSPTPSASASAATSSSSSSAAAKAAMTQQEQRAAGPPLRCPRCDSANTKFCYYNNYSLSQPRHFCKACKRYWTRGGTLRNVPVGGGCRKNKRVKKQHHQPNTTTTATTTVSATVTVNSDPLPSPPPLPTSSDLSAFFYGLTTSDMNMNLGSTAAAAYDALGLGGLIPTLASNQLMNTNLADLQQQPSSSSSFLHHHSEQYPSSFGSQAASLLMSSFKQQPKKAEDQYAGQSFLPYDSSSANLGFPKDVKVEGDHSNLNNLMSNNIGTEWQAGGYPLIEANINGVTDASFLYWNQAMGGAAVWPDAANSSVAPLI